MVTTSVAWANRASALKSRAPCNAARLNCVCWFWTHNRTSLRFCKAFMHLAVHGLTKASWSCASVNCRGKPLVTAPFGARAKTNGMGARLTPNLSTTGFSFGSVI